ncbi:MAG: hypothetical protein KJO69_01155 [Gammaproteobacteria bacterium]|nr:hypothetical protein [Gammaproteobacteria bacterium]
MAVPQKTIEEIASKMVHEYSTVDTFLLMNIIEDAIEHYKHQSMEERTAEAKSRGWERG